MNKDQETKLGASKGFEGIDSSRIIKLVKLPDIAAWRKELSEKAEETRRKNPDASPEYRRTRQLTI